MGLADRKWVLFQHDSVGRDYFLIGDPTGFETTYHVEEASGFATAREAYAFAEKYSFLAAWRVGLRP